LAEDRTLKILDRAKLKSHFQCHLFTSSFCISFTFFFTLTCRILCS